MKTLPVFRGRFTLSMVIISAVVGILIHFPEVLSLSDQFHELFPGMRMVDVVNEVLFTFVSLLILFGVNTKIFHINDSMAKVTIWKVLLSFVLMWVISSMLGKLFVLLHQHFDIPAIDAMVHHYLHPIRDFVMAGIVTGSCYIIHLVQKEQRMVVENQELRTESILNQYQVLKNQLNPHMLFNSLNTLQSLIREAPDKALNYTQELSHVLRYTLQSDGSKGVPLSEEMTFVEAYAFLLKMRYEGNLEFEISVSENLHTCLVPPMAVQVLVENAVKHNEISNRKPLIIDIKTLAEGMLCVTNPVQSKLTPVAGTGIGLDNLSKRYRLLFNKDIQIYDENGIFSVRIPLIKASEL